MLAVDSRGGAVRTDGLDAVTPTYDRSISTRDLRSPPSSDTPLRCRQRKQASVMRFLLRGSSGSGGETAVKRPRVGLALVDATGSISRWSAGGGKNRSRECVQVEVAEDCDGVTVKVGRLEAWSSRDCQLRHCACSDGAPAGCAACAGLPQPSSPTLAHLPGRSSDGEPDLELFMPSHMHHTKH